VKKLLSIPIVLIALIAVSIHFNIFLGPYILTDKAQSTYAIRIGPESSEDSSDFHWHESASTWLCSFH
jgi:hypothetical protein